MKSILSILLLTLSFSASASYYCIGKVGYLGSSTKLSVSNGHGVYNLCEVNEEKCKLWASMILSAKIADRKIAIYYQSSSSNTGDQSTGVCKDIGDWVTPNDTPYHVQIF